VSTVDTIGNESAPSLAVTATLVAKDTVAPATPSQPRITAVSTTSVTLQWAHATDNVGVTAYRVSRDGAFVTTVNAPAFVDHGLAAGQTYNYTVVAVDAAGNQSGQSETVTVKTKSGRTRAVRH
jgi:chitodextrinase